MLYAAIEPAKIGEAALEFVRDPRVILYASHVSLWEITIKVTIGKLKIPMTPDIFWKEIISRIALRELPIRPNAILKTIEFDLSHRDPFDRLLSAQSMVEGLVFLSHDEAVDAWGVNRAW